MAQLNQALIQACMQSESSTQAAMKALAVKSGLSADGFVASLAQLMKTEALTLADMQLLTPDFDTISYHEAVAKHCVLLRNENKETILVYADIYDQALHDWSVGRVQGALMTKLAHWQDITDYLDLHEKAAITVSQPMTQAESKSDTSSKIEVLSLSEIELESNAVIRLVRSTLFDALKADASDVHFEVQPDGLVIKYRLDGVMTQVLMLQDMTMAEQAISRIKVLAELDITEQRIPQDGRFRAVYRDREVDFRVSVMPSVHGEDVVIRVLDKQTLAEKSSGLSLEVLGFDEASKTAMREQFLMPYGMVLVTGPTGSGKTTTLYAAISEINDGQDKIITIEDPVEYQLSGVLQIPVHEKKGLTFAKGLRSILRHDPDKIMVGEIRDAETAQIAVQSALTGHLVLTSVHANNVFDVIGRFLNMGVDAYSFVSSLNIIVAQRLLRLICTECKTEDKVNNTSAENHTFYHGKGCSVCRETGYKGRQAVAEILKLDDDLREMIVNRAPIKQIKQVAQEKGTVFLHTAAMALAKSGKTSMAEVQRVAPMV